MFTKKGVEMQKSVNVKKMKSGLMQRRESRLGILLILPTLILIGAVVIYPICYNVALRDRKSVV